MNSVQFAQLLVVLRDDPFLGISMRYALLRTELVHHMLAFEAQLGLE